MIQGAWKNIHTWGEKHLKRGHNGAEDNRQPPAPPPTTTTIIVVVKSRRTITKNTTGVSRSSMRKRGSTYKKNVQCILMSNYRPWLLTNDVTYLGGWGGGGRGRDLQEECCCPPPKFLFAVTQQRCINKGSKEMTEEPLLRLPKASFWNHYLEIEQLGLEQHVLSLDGKLPQDRVKPMSPCTLQERKDLVLKSSFKSDNPIWWTRVPNWTKGFSRSGTQNASLLEENDEEEREPSKNY